VKKQKRQDKYSYFTNEAGMEFEQDSRFFRAQVELSLVQCHASFMLLAQRPAQCLAKHSPALALSLALACYLRRPSKNLIACGGGRV
jgi:hypothetical protein